MTPDNREDQRNREEEVRKAGPDQQGGKQGERQAPGKEGDKRQDREPVAPKEGQGGRGDSGGQQGGQGKKQGGSESEGDDQA